MASLGPLEPAIPVRARAPQLFSVRAIYEHMFDDKDGAEVHRSGGAGGDCPVQIMG